MSLRHIMRNPADQKFYIKLGILWNVNNHFLVYNYNFVIYFFVFLTYRIGDVNDANICLQPQTLAFGD